LYIYPDANNPKELFDLDWLDEEDNLIIICVIADVSHLKKHTVWIWKGNECDVLANDINNFIEKCKKLFFNNEEVEYINVGANNESEEFLDLFD